MKGELVRLYAPCDLLVVLIPWFGYLGLVTYLPCKSSDAILRKGGGLIFIAF